MTWFIVTWSRRTFFWRILRKVASKLLTSDLRASRTSECTRTFSRAFIELLKLFWGFLTHPVLICGLSGVLWQNLRWVIRYSRERTKQTNWVWSWKFVAFLRQRCWSNRRGKPSSLTTRICPSKWVQVLMAKCANRAPKFSMMSSARQTSLLWISSKDVSSGIQLNVWVPTRPFDISGFSKDSRPKCLSTIKNSMAFLRRVCRVTLKRQELNFWKNSLQRCS